MIRHLLKLVWNRKRANGLIILEIFLSFLVVFVVLALGVSYWIDWHTPVGYRTDRVWYVSLSSGEGDEWVAGQAPVLERLLDELAGLDEVEAATRASGLPLDGSVSVYAVDAEDGKTLYAEVVRASPGYRGVFGIDLVAGRWFEEADLGLERAPAVIDADLAREAFGAEDPLGRDLPFENSRVIGVVAEFRKDGALQTPERDEFLFLLHRPADPGTVLTKFALRLRPGVTAAFEETLVAHARAIAPGWNLEVQDLDALRTSKLKLRAAPLVAALVVAVFLLAMVALGLIGVMWQNVAQRTREIGLRRAVGAWRGAVHRQILLELLLMTTIGLGLGTLTVAQLPLVELWDFLTPRVFLLGLTASVALIYALAVLCGLYPSWMATRVRPAEALHYE